MSEHSWQGQPVEAAHGLICPFCGRQAYRRRNEPHRDLVCRVGHQFPQRRALAGPSPHNEDRHRAARAPY